MISRRLLMAGLVLLLAGCQAGLQTKPDGAEAVEYGIFYDQGDHLEDLVNAGKLTEAKDLVNDHYDFFKDSSGLTGKNRFEKYAVQIRAVSDYLNNTITKPKVDQANVKLSGIRDKLTDQKKWSEIRAALAWSSAIVRAYESNRLVHREGFFSPQVAALDKRIKKEKDYFEGRADEEFSKHLKESEAADNFFAIYPVDVDAKEVLIKAEETILSHVQEGGVPEIEAFLGTYGDYLTSKNVKVEIGQAFVEKFIADNKGNGKPELAILLDAVTSAKKIGLNVDVLKKFKIAFVEVTSKTLLKEGQVEFPATIDMDLPFETKQAEVEHIFEDTADVDYIIIFDVALANVTRRVKERSQESSKYLAGYQTKPNKEYTAAQLYYQKAQMGFQNASNQVCYGDVYARAGCQIGQAIAIGAWSNRMQEAEAALLATPETIEVPVHKDYKFSKSGVDVKKNLTANYYVVNLKDRRYFKSTFDVTEERAFTLLYDLKDEDLNRSVLLSRYDSEESISQYEENPVSINVSDLLGHYVENISQEVALRSEKDLRTEIMFDKNQALAEYKKNKYDARPLNDHRFDHVVVVHNPAGSLGTGFYVAPDLVLTNYHVIEGSKYAEMKLYNGHETFGKVVKSDVRMDLALVKVQEKGKPVKFYEKNTIDLGKTVEAIGHPKGLEFTITRGVISALRKMSSPFDTGGDDVLFVQTDTPINPGNSGGPLFLGDYVVGVNDQKFSAAGVEGLGFAIHYSEVAKFLDEEF